MKDLTGIDCLRSLIRDSIPYFVEEKVESLNRLESEIDIQLLKAEKNKQSALASAFSGKIING